MPVLRKPDFLENRIGRKLHGRRKCGYQVEEETVERSAGIKDRSQSILKGIVSSVVSSLAVVANLVS